MLFSRRLRHCCDMKAAVSVITKDRESFMKKIAADAPETEMRLTDAVRAGCARVMEQARYVHIRADMVARYAERISSFFPYENLWHAAGWHFRSNSDEAL